MFGIGLAYIQDRHVRFTVLTDFLPCVANERRFAGIDALTAVTGVVLTRAGIAFARHRRQVEARA